jgi:hypothetical protein
MSGEYYSDSRSRMVQQESQTHRTVSNSDSMCNRGPYWLKLDKGPVYEVLHQSTDRFLMSEVRVWQTAEPRPTAAQ